MKIKALIVCLFLSVIACDDIVEVENISNEIVSVLAPTNEVVLNTNEITFTWEAVVDANAYTLQIAQPNFVNATQIVLDSIISKTSFAKTLESGSYQWRIRASNTDYHTRYTTLSFEVDTAEIPDISNAQIVLSSPADNAAFSDSETLNFSWETIEGATGYVFQIATPNFENPAKNVEDKTLTETSFSVSSLEKENYQWRVKAKNAIHETNYTTQNFIIQ